MSYPVGLQLLVQRWNATYPKHQWDDDRVIGYRWTVVARDKSVTEMTERVQWMGAMLLDGVWRDVFEGVTWVEENKKIDVGDRAKELLDEIKASIKVENKRWRLVRRHPDGSQTVISSTSNGLTQDKKEKRHFRGLDRVIPPTKSEDPKDLVRLVLQVPDGVLGMSDSKKLYENFKNILLHKKLTNFDVTLVCTLLTNKDLGLLRQDSFLPLRAALDNLKTDRNVLLAHEGQVEDIEFKAAIKHIREFLKLTVDLKLFPQD